MEQVGTFSVLFFGLNMAGLLLLNASVLFYPISTAVALVNKKSGETNPFLCLSPVPSWGSSAPRPVPFVPHELLPRPLPNQTA